LQASEPSGPESLQSQTRPWPKKRLSISRLGVVHRRLLTWHHERKVPEGNRKIAKYFVPAKAIRDFMPVEFRP
jgi:hypothetical protein